MRVRIIEKATVRGKEPAMMNFGGTQTPVKAGKHCLWLPEMGAKIIWSHNGRIESFRDWDLGRNKEILLDGSFNLRGGWDDTSLQSIYSEYAFMKRLSEGGLAPPVGEMFFIKLMISDYPTGVEYCDVRGRFGYYISDANGTDIHPGEFSKERFDRFIADEGVEISKDAYGDIFKPGNIVNGYLIDVRRTLWDMLKFPAAENIGVPRPTSFEAEALRTEIAELGQFPYKERKKNYQDYYMDGIFHEGSRNTVYRFDAMKLEDFKGMHVVDLGCQLGTVLFECFKRGGTKLLGIDHEKDYVNLARKLSAYNDMPINFVRMDLMDWKQVAKYVKRYYQGNMIDVVFALSIYKHIGDVMFDILGTLPWYRCYVESHNAPAGLKTDHVRRMVAGMDKLNAKVTYLGQTSDRSPRCVWRLEA